MELLITLAIASIAATLIIPAFNDFVIDTKEKTATNNVISAIRKARSEAVTRNTPVSICRRDGTSDNCDTAADTGWQDGWLIFEDTNRDGQANAGETILVRHGPLDGELTITAQDSAVEDFIRFSSSGRPGNTGAMLIAYDSTGYTISINNSGRVSYAEPDGG